MKTLSLVGAALAALLSGCATDPEIAKLAMQRQPTLKVTCPVGGCDIEYRDPRDQVRMPTNGYDAAIAISGQITGLVGGAVVPAALGAVAVHGFDALKGSGQVTTTTTTIDDHSATAPPTVVQQPAPVIVPPADPVIVPQPAPVIVPPADPVIVEQPAPIIVQQPAPIVIQGVQ